MSYRYQGEYIYHWTSVSSSELIRNVGKILPMSARNKGTDRELPAVYLTKYESPSEVREKLGVDIFLEVRIDIPILFFTPALFANKNANFDGSIKYDPHLNILTTTGEIAYLDEISLGVNWNIEQYVD